MQTSGESKVAARFIERKAPGLLEAIWTSPEGTTIDLIARDEDTLIVIDVTTAEDALRAWIRQLDMLKEGETTQVEYEA